MQVLFIARLNYGVRCAIISEQYQHITMSSVLYSGWRTHGYVMLQVQLQRVPVAPPALLGCQPA